MSDEIVKKELYPSNSLNKKKKEKDVELPKKTVEKVVTGEVTVKKKTIGDKFKETFVADDAENVGSYIFKDVVIPTVKETIVDIVTKGINMIFYGDTRSAKSSTSQPTSSFNYGRYFTPDSQRRVIDNRTRVSHNFNNLEFTTRGEAEEVRNNLVELTYMYGQATVADLYDLAGITSEYTDHKYGWEELGSSKVRRVSNGYIIILPKAMLLEGE